MRIYDLLSGAGELAEGGIEGTQAASVASLLLDCADTLRGAGLPDTRTACAFWVPGRIEVLGKHTDYLGGRSLLAATERGLVVIATERSDDRVRVLQTQTGERAEFRFSPELQPEPGHWTNYPMTVARRLARNFPGPLRGAEIAFASNLPAAAGMSSSSALMIACFLALSTVNRLDATKTYRGNIGGSEDLAGYLAAVENGGDFRALRGDRGVGTQGGSEDHTAILCARAGHLVQYAFGPVRSERAVPMPPGYTFVVASSGVRAEKTGPAMARYNRVAELGRELLQLWHAETGRDDSTLALALEANPSTWGRLAIPKELARRLNHFVAESRDIIPAAGDALATGDLASFGALVDRSQQLAERLLGNQIPETTQLARAARELGAAAASAFGAGFGGSVWALVGERDGAAFLVRWRSRYLERCPEHTQDAEFLLTSAGPPACRLA